MIRLVESLSYGAEGRALLVEESVDGVEPEPAAVVVLGVEASYEPGVSVDEVCVLQTGEELLNELDHLEKKKFWNISETDYR